MPFCTFLGSFGVLVAWLLFKAYEHWKISIYIAAKPTFAPGKSWASLGAEKDPILISGLESGALQRIASLG